MNNQERSERVNVGDRVRFDGKRTSWLARAETRSGRYTLLTASMFGNVFYSIIDWEKGIRGPMNVIGHGLGIFTTSGADSDIDEAIDMLDGVHDSSLYEGQWTISHRDNVPVRITSSVAASSGGVS